MKLHYLSVLIITAVSPALAWSQQDEGCAKVGATMYMALTESIINDLYIYPGALISETAKVKVLSIVPVAKSFAQQLADATYKNQPGTTPSKEALLSDFYKDGAKNITAQYTFTNQQGKHAVFIASSLMNNHECSVRFNGYLTVSREF